LPDASFCHHERDTATKLGCALAYTVSPSEYQPHAGSTVPVAVYMQAATQPVSLHTSAALQKGVPKQASKHHTTDHNACEHCSWWVNLLPTEAQQQCKRGHASSCTCNTAAQHCLRHPLHATQQHTSSRCARQTALERQDLSCTYLAHHELESNVTITTAAQRCLKSPMHVTGTTGGAGDSAE